MVDNILGVDVAKATFDVALQRSGTSLIQGSFANSAEGFRQLKTWLKRHQVAQLHACLEATGRYGEALATFLYQSGYTVSIVNPARIHAYAKSKLQRNKTDRTDAKLIADFCATQQPPAWQPPTVWQAEMQALTRHLETLKQNRLQESNRLKAGNPSAVVRETIEAHLRFLDEQIARLEQEIRQQTAQDKQQQHNFVLLTSIPGISALTAAKFLAEVPDVTLFAQADQLTAWAGLSPSHHESGITVRKKSRLSKSGNRPLRTAFYMPALSAMRFNPLVKALVERLEAQGKHRMVIVGAAMRKLLCLAYGVLKTGKPFDPNYLSPKVAIST
jgi:transposase